MYCVKCGVRLQDGVPSCPLCGTPVWNPLQEEKESSPSMYSDRMPLHNNSSTVPQAALITVLFLLAIFAVFVICRELYG
ncbi:MAG: zinc ribbon domain-containing protein, partial [Lachnospiraceae bacterium]|nr:zinc ribbon domain-containing protein [Lachnospiraceae bacterium]